MLRSKQQNWIIMFENTAQNVGRILSILHTLFNASAIRSVVNIEHVSQLSVMVSGV